MNVEGHDSPRSRGRVIRWPRAYDLMVRTMSLGREGRLRRQLVEHGRVSAGEAVLDVGSGTGTLLRAVREVVPDVGRLCGLEPSSEMIEHARRLASEAGVDLELEQGFADCLPFPDQSFDVVFCSFVIHHLPPTTPKAAFGEMRRVLRPGGRLVVADFKRGHSEPLGTRIHDAVGRLLHHRGSPPRRSRPRVRAPGPQPPRGLPARHRRRHDLGARHHRSARRQGPRLAAFWTPPPGRRGKR